MKDYSMEYARKRAEAVRELNNLRHKLIGSKCSVDVINKAFKLKKQYNL